MNAVIEARCRRCPACLAQRAREWRARANTEYQRSARTWLGSLTLSPERRLYVLSKCRDRLAHNGLDFETLCADDQFREKCTVIGAEVTRYVKRVRAASKVPLHILVVTEKHEGGGAAHGEPHYHILWHERLQGQHVRSRQLKSAWSWGFTKFNLVKDQRGATYVTKYLTKSNLARVRASKGYGD